MLFAMTSKFRKKPKNFKINRKGGGLKKPKSERSSALRSSALSEDFAGMQRRVIIFNQVECGVQDRLHIYPLCGVFYFPWNRQQIEGIKCF